MLKFTLRNAIVLDLDVVVDVFVELLLDRRVLQQLANDVGDDRSDTREKRLVGSERPVDLQRARERARGCRCGRRGGATSPAGTAPPA